MIANSAFVAAIVLALLIALLGEQLAFLAPYRRLIVQDFLWPIVCALVAIFVNVFALFYGINRRLFLKDTGRKLAHVEKQLLTPDSIVRDLSDRLPPDGRTPSPPTASSATSPTGSPGTSDAADHMTHVWVPTLSPAPPTVGDAWRYRRA